MDVKEIKAKRHILNEALRKLISEFEKETDTRVKSVNILRTGDMMFGQELYSLSTDVELIF